MSYFAPDHKPNELEQALLAAINDPEAVRAFYGSLLQSNVWVVGEVQDGEPGPDGEIPAGASVALGHNQLSDGTTYVPFFTSAEVLTSQAGEDTPKLRVGARDLMAMTAGTTLGMNPGTDSGKVMPAELVNELLGAVDAPAGAGGNPGDGTEPGEQQLRVGLPAQEPVAVVEAVTPVFSNNPDVTAAYYCAVDVGDGTPPRLLVGIDGADDLSEAVREAGSVTADVDTGGLPVDFLEIPNDVSGLGEYLRANGVQFVGTPS